MACSLPILVLLSFILYHKLDRLHKACVFILDHFTGQAQLVSVIYISRCAVSLEEKATIPSFFKPVNISHCAK